ncbi:MAG: permease [Acidobacteria bacterium]|nr:permease [Acidobacteriota bacterium]|tara:strand:+ start:486 stop:1775 length:1290 start_codon:yes stop_codon:yes gene_type:complete
MTEASGQGGGAIAPSRLWVAFGPGLLWAATAIGVSHLVQSTRAGASAGFGLCGVILLALILKYPFFEYGPRYAAATGNSLVEGYAKVGRWALWLYLFITVLTTGVIQSAVVMFTAYLLGFAIGVEWHLPVLAAGVMIPGAALLWWGRFRGLDFAIKVIVLLLGLSTLLAATVSVPRAQFSTLAIWPENLVGSILPFAFLLALVGWMPSAIDISVWSSLWTLAKNDTSGRVCSVETARQDFLVGYVGTAVLAFAFVTLGASVMFGSEQMFAQEGTLFSTQLVELYSSTLGGWTRPVVLVAVVTTMLSTTLTVLDGGPRAIERTIFVLRTPNPVRPPVSCGPVYWWSLVALVSLTLIVMAVFIGDLTTMVDFATTLAFLTGPLLGYLNLRAVTSDEMPPQHRPGRAMLVVSWTGIVLLGGTGLFYLGSVIS